MTTPLSDEDFLAEIDRFLTSCDTPLQSSTCTPRLQTSIKSKLTAHRSNRVTNAFVIKREIERAKDRNRRKVYRERRRLERDFLKLQVTELSGILHRTQQVKTSKSSLSSAAWKAVAKQQLEALQAAQVQQEVLKMAVETRFQLIQDFGGFMNDRLYREDALEKKLTSSDHKPVEIGSPDAHIFETFLQELDAVNAVTNDIFQEVDADSTSSWAFDTGTGGFGFTDRREMAFDFKLASQILWQRAHTLNCQEDRVIYRLKDPSDTVAVKFRISRRLNCGQPVSVVQCMVGRRYKEKNRFVVVWRSFTEGEGVFLGIHSDETGWCIAEPSEIKSDKPVTSLTIRIRHKPIHFDNEKESVVEQFSRLLCTTGSEDFIQIVSSLDLNLDPK
ncbi:hypothetical protein V7S43_004115 [Phytophthora oleae]|uniref:M96 mating-specific protein family n=1 Tax=Phytophthora oleae TaxID=2107226 RepID=A0ABD3FYV2_9STRA